MRKIRILGSISTLILLLGCSGNSPKHPAANASASAGTSAVAATTSSAPEIATPLPAPTAGHLSLQPWRPQPVDDHLGGAVVLKRTSLDGKYDLVILEKGAAAFLSFARHARWDSVHDREAKGTLMHLRLKFEDGEEKQVAWDELGSGTDNLYAVLWSYPAKSDSVGGDQLLMQDLMKHRAMVLEIGPGVTAQFDLTGLGSEMDKIRPNQPEPVLAASQAAE